MSRASDILRERANDRVGADPDELRALADLLEACVVEEQRINGATPHTCKLCEAWAWLPDVITHESDCALAALERAITGESDAEGK